MAKLLDFMVRCNNASEDDAVEDILRMSDPDSFDSKDEMRDHFDECLGYDPFEYFDRRSIEEQFDELITGAPYSVQDQLRNKREEIINRTLDCIDDVGDTVLRKVFIDVVKDTIGWQPIEDSEVSLDDCISMAIFGNEDIDDPNEYEDEEDDDDSLDYEDDDEETSDDF